MALLRNPFQPKHPPRVMAVIYLLLLGYLVLDALLLFFGRSAYLAIRIFWSIPANTMTYLNGGLFGGAVIAMFIHLLASERTLTDLDYPRPVLVSAGRVAGIQLIALAVVQLVMLILLPVPAVVLRSSAIIVVSLGAGVSLITLSVRNDERRKLRR